ncbi:hypothetical protein BT69DRAFT_561757 [Atractiella rhizophila]|nr:hypothetical protein BT69DRAFT_561757 [Atractiella rhizophila]
MHAITGRIPYLIIRLIQAFGVGRETKILNIMQEIEVSIGHFPLLFTTIDLIPLMVWRVHNNRKYTHFSALIGLALTAIMISAIVGGIFEGIYWWDARNGSFSKQDKVLSLRQLTTVAPFDVNYILMFNLLRIIYEKRRQEKVGNTCKKLRFRWLSISPTADFSKLSAEGLTFLFITLAPTFVTTLYKVILASFHLVPTPQDPSAYPLPMELFYATPRSNGLFYTLQLTMEVISLTAYAFFDVRKIYGLEGQWGWSTGVPRGRGPRESVQQETSQAADQNELEASRSSP